MVGSLKKGTKQTLSLPSTAYNTLPSHHHLRSSTSSPRFIANNHKRSPSSDSGHGTLHHPVMVNSRSNTPVSYHGGEGHSRRSGGRSNGGGSGGKVQHHTVFLHGKIFVIWGTC